MKASEAVKLLTKLLEVLGDCNLYAKGGRVIPKTNEMAQTKRAKITFVCDHEVRAQLDDWAAAENRSVSNLVETLITEVLAERPVNSTLLDWQNTHKRKQEAK